MRKSTESCRKSEELHHQNARAGQGKNMMIFPYAHLAMVLSSREVALNILKGLESMLIEEGFNVKRAQFDWYKEFELKTKSHTMLNSTSKYRLMKFLEILLPSRGALPEIGVLYHICEKEG